MNNKIKDLNTSEQTHLSSILPIQQTIPRQSLLSLGRPPGRRECKLLSQWVTAKLSEKHAEGIERVVYEFSLLELMRQTSVQCAERGALFKQLYNGIKKTYDESLEKMQRKKIEEQADLRLQAIIKDEQINKLTLNLENVIILIRQTIM